MLNDRHTTKERAFGAQLWHHAAPWRPDPEDALLALQVQVLAERYDLPKLVRERLESVREAVRTVEADGDEYGLLETYRAELAMLQDVAGSPLPDDPVQQIELVRKLSMNSGEGIGNVLDVTGISDHREIHVAERLTEREVVRLVGASRPTLTQAGRAAGKINEELGRGESVCFAFFDDHDSERPAGWYFVGNTID